MYTQDIAEPLSVVLRGDSIGEFSLIEAVSSDLQGSFCIETFRCVAQEATTVGTGTTLAFLSLLSDLLQSLLSLPFALPTC